MKITGQMLKETREAQKLSLSEISMSTKINQRMLKAIEEGDLKNLPAKTFLRGFVQAYAIALKLDVDQVMNTFLDEMGTTTPEVAEVTEDNAVTPPTNTRQVPPSMETSSTTKIIVVAGIVALILVVFGIKSIVEKYERESQVEPPPETLESLPAAAPTETSTPEEEEKVEEAQAEPTPETKQETKPEATPAPAVATNPQPEVTTPAPKLEVTTPPPTPEPAPSEPAQPEPVATAPTATETPKPKPALETAQSKEIILEALDRIEVAVKINNEALRKVVLQPDEVYTIKGEGKISLDLSDGGAVNLIVNGRDRGVPGDLGKPKKVELP